jgi:curved DNA-binding protein CbpA
MEKTYYEILGLETYASEKEIKQAYRQIARTLHPDKAIDEGDRKEKEQLFADVSEAYNALKDKVKRAEYDLKLKKLEEKGFIVKKKTDKKVDSTQRSATGTGISRSNERDLIAKKAYTKGMQILKEGDYNKAITFFEAAIENDNTEAIYFFRLAQAMMHAKKSFTRAVEYCNKAIIKEPYNNNYKLLLGEIYEMAGIKSNARKIYEDILKWEKTNEVARERLKLMGFSVDNESKSFFVKLFKKIRGG